MAKDRWLSKIWKIEGMFLEICGIYRVQNAIFAHSSPFLHSKDS